MAQDHDTGFMIRYTAGASYARSGQKADLPGNPRYNISGAALDMDLAAGFALSENFAVHATGSFWRAFNPKVNGDFGRFSVSGDTDDESLTLFGIGGGFTAWTASDMYVSALILVSMRCANYYGFVAVTDWCV